VEAVRAIAAKYQFDISGGRLRPRGLANDLADRTRAGVGQVPVPGGTCREINNVRADGHGCPVYYRCFSCKFFTTDFTQLPELRQLRDTKAEQLVRLEAAYGSLLVPGPLTRANVELLRQELVQIDELIGKCETDLGSLTEEDKATVEAGLHSRDRFLTVIPVASVLAGRQQLAQPTIDPILLTGEARCPAAAARRGRHRRAWTPGVRPPWTRASGPPRFGVVPIAKRADSACWTSLPVRARPASHSPSVPRSIPSTCNGTGT
jgi:hypothetical protein